VGQSRASPRRQTGTETRMPRPRRLNASPPRRAALPHARPRRISRQRRPTRRKASQRLAPPFRTIAKAMSRRRSRVKSKQRIGPGRTSVLGRASLRSWVFALREHPLADASPASAAGAPPPVRRDAAAAQTPARSSQAGGVGRGLRPDNEPEDRSSYGDRPGGRMDRPPGCRGAAGNLVSRLCATEHGTCRRSSARH
jgi:hypothetical protein